MVKTMKWLIIWLLGQMMDMILNGSKAKLYNQERIGLERSNPFLIALNRVLVGNHHVVMNTQSSIWINEKVEWKLSA